MNKKKVTILVLIIIIVAVILIGLISNEEVEAPIASETVTVINPDDVDEELGTVDEYFLIKENALYTYTSDNDIYNQYQYNMYENDDMFEWKIVVPSLGAEFSNVAQYDGDSYSLYYADNTFKHREPLFDEEENAYNVFLKNPVVEGNSWAVNDWTVSEITNVDATVEVPYGEFNAVEVTTNESGGDYKVDYYVRDLGLIKTIYTYPDGTEIVQELSNVEENTPLPLTYTRYDYNVVADEIDTITDTTYVYSNPDYESALEESLKVSMGDDYVPLLTENTTINSITLDDEDYLCTIDLSQDFLTEMNLGSDIESNVLECIERTIGNFYSANSVIITIDGQVYESGHIKLDEPLSLIS